jgi:hypothetical protein
VSTKVDAVCLALVALWDANPDLSSVTIADGPQANSEASNEWLFVGADGDAPDEGTEAVSAEQDWMAFAKTKQETADVTCAVVVRDGGSNVSALRPIAFGILSDAEDALRADPTLGGLVMQSHISSHQYIPVITQGGCKARVVFTVTYLAQL